MKYYVFGKNFTFLNKPILDLLKDTIDYEYLGENVDLSKLPKDKDFYWILILNPNILTINFKKFSKFVEENKDKNIFVARKIKTFGCVIFKENKQIDKFIVNKLYIFIGILGVKRENLYPTMAETIKNLPKDNTAVYIQRKGEK